MNEPTSDRGPGPTQRPHTPGDDYQAGHETGQEASPVLRSAIESLRSRRDPRWVEVSDRILDTALRATRPSASVVVSTPTGPVRVSEQVITAYLRDALDAAIPGVAMMRLVLQVEGRDHLGGLTICMVARYGTNLLLAADRTRDLTRVALETVLGPNSVAVEVAPMRVHFEDVLPGDPAVEDPWPG
ncbi:hypothetical protein [Jannaschia sp. R86511]|uniref:hypothetical protein n=1 Tax=Jannaschia sp. R86511 TaxID=3093853 RepID=UPI0036D401CC